MNIYLCNSFILNLVIVLNQNNNSMKKKTPIFSKLNIKKIHDNKNNKIKLISKGNIQILGEKGHKTGQKKASLELC